MRPGGSSLSHTRRELPAPPAPTRPAPGPSAVAAGATRAPAGIAGSGRRGEAGSEAADEKRPVITRRSTRTGSIQTLRIVPGEVKRPSTKDLEAARQRWREKQLALGRCVNCGRKRTSYKWRCDRCQKKAREWAKRKYAPRFDTIRKKSDAEKRATRFINMCERRNGNG